MNANEQANKIIRAYSKKGMCFISSNDHTEMNVRAGARDYILKNAKNVAQAYLDLLAKQEGHKLVPLEPSTERLKAGCKEYGKSDCGSWNIVYAIYKAMINVKP